MMRKIKDKIDSQSGETLVEVLVSLLISTIAIGLLFTSIMTAAHINQANKEADAKFYKELQIAETLISQEGYESEEIQIHIIFQTVDDKTLDVTRYGGEDGAFASYTHTTEGDE